MGQVSMPQGKGSQMHNRREYEKYGKPTPDNIDASKSHENIFLVDKDIREAYQEIFGEALEKYNANKKPCRKITDYYDHIQKSKNGEKLFYEDVVQWGSMTDFENSPETRQKAKEALVQYAKGFEARNPNLKLIGAYIHMDEASPHLHLDYVPVAHGYKNGLQVRNSLDKAMKEMGFIPEKESRKNNATKLWKENERAVFGDICRSMGLEVGKERKARGSLSVEEYKEARESMINKIQNDYSDKMDELQSNLISGLNQLESIQADITSKKDELSQVKVELEPLREEYDRKAQALTEIEDKLSAYELDGNYQLIKENEALKEENTKLRETNNRLLKFIQDLFKKAFGKEVQDLFNMRFGRKKEKQIDPLER